MAHFEIVRTDALQPWHVRLVADNGEPVLVSENYADRRDALHAIDVAAETGFDVREVDERGRS